MGVRSILTIGAMALGSLPALAGDNLKDLTASEAAAQIASGALSPQAYVDALLNRIGDDRGNAFITLDADGAKSAALKEPSEKGPLFGVPIVVKDNIAVQGLPNTAGTPALANWRPAKDAPVVERLRKAGAIILGKTNLHELAFGITSNNAVHGAVANAYALDRFAGGSSGGTGAAIGARFAPVGLGTDTGGSVRIPAALNGVYGFRPSVGRYPQAGIVPISHTRDTAGPLARSMKDIILIDGVITNGTTTLGALNLSGVRVGIPSAFNGHVDGETDRLVKAALEKLEAAGVTLVTLDLADIQDLNGQIGFPIALFEAKQDISKFLEKNETGLTIDQLAAEITSPDVKFVFDNMILGDQAVPEVAYRSVMNDLRPKLQARYAEVFADHRLDALAFPTTPLPAQPISGSDLEVELLGAKVPTFQTFIRNTDPGSNAGLPGLSIPVGLTSDGLPVGLELDGPAFSDRHLLALGLAVEALLPPTPAP